MILIKKNFFRIYNMKVYSFEITCYNTQQFDFKIFSAWYFGMWHFKMAAIGFLSYGCIFLSFVTIFSVLQWSYVFVGTSMCILYTNTTLNAKAASDKSNIVNNIYVYVVYRMCLLITLHRYIQCNFGLCSN